MRPFSSHKACHCKPVYRALAAKGVFVVVKPGHPHVPGLEGRGRLLEQGARIAAVATGVAQGALDVAVRYAKERESFGKPIIDHQGLAFLLADMAAAVESARATYLYAARLRDAGRRFSRHASIAKMKFPVVPDRVLMPAGFRSSPIWQLD